MMPDEWACCAYRFSVHYKFCPYCGEEQPKPKPKSLGQICHAAYYCDGDFLRHEKAAAGCWENFPTGTRDGWERAAQAVLRAKRLKPKTLETPKEIEVKVIQEDIDNGDKKATGHCPIARALIRKGWEDVHVDNYSSVVELDFQRYTYKYTERVDDFINAFDQGYSVRPTTFILVRDDG